MQQTVAVFRAMFSRKWIFTTLLVVAAVAVMARLGVWQLDRLAARRAFNARVMAQQSAPPLDLQGDALSLELSGMEYRAVTARGRYDFEHQIALRNQAYAGQWGVHLITPLLIEGSRQAVLVDRGWIPAEDYESGNWSKYSETGLVTVQGVIRASRSRPDFGRRADPTPAPGAGPLKTWNFVNVARIDEQTPASLLPVYIQQAPEEGRSDYPVRSLPDLELSEGSHMGYAIQWFAFAALLGFGYPFYLRKQEHLEMIQSASLAHTR